MRHDEIQGQWLHGLPTPRHQRAATHAHRAVSRVIRLIVIVCTLIALGVQTLPAGAAPLASAKGKAHHGKQAAPVKSQMTSQFTPQTLTGRNCAVTTTSPLIYNCGVSGIFAGSATVIWESDVNVAASVCVGTAAYSAGQCQINNGGASEQCDHTWGTNPGFTAMNDQVAKNQLPNGNWMYAAIVPLGDAGTYHYQIVMQSGTNPAVISNDLSFAVPTIKPDFEDTFGGAAVATTPYFSQTWTNGPGVGAGNRLFQDTFSSGSALSASWQVVSGTWGVDSTQGVATSSAAGETYETPANLGATAGTGELVVSVYLPVTTTQYPSDDAGIVIYEDLSSPNHGKVLLVLDTNANCQADGTGCASGELASGLWLRYTDPTSGALQNKFLSSVAVGAFQPAVTYTFDVRVSGSFISVFDQTAPINPWTYVTSGEARVAINQSTTYSITTGQVGFWDNAPTATPVQYGPISLYDTPTVPTGLTANPTTQTVKAVFSPNSTVAQSILSASATNPFGVAVTQNNDEVDFTSDTLGGVIVRADNTGAGDTFAVSLGTGGITGSINGGGSSGQISGTAPWQLEARFDGTALSLYGEASGSSTWQLLAVGNSQRSTGGYVWPLPTSSSLIGNFSLRSITTPALHDWQSTTGADVTTTSENANTPGKLLLRHVGSGSSTEVHTWDVDIEDGTLAIPFEVNNPDLAGITFRAKSGVGSYEVYFYKPLTNAAPQIIKTTPSGSATLAAFPNTCSFFGGPGPYTAYITLLGQVFCVSFAPSLWGEPVAQLCVNDPYGWTGGSIGLVQDNTTDIAIDGVRYYSGRDPKRWFAPVGGVDMGSGTYNEANTDLSFPAAGRGQAPEWRRNYSSSAGAQNIAGPMGIGWFSNYTSGLFVNPDSSISVTTQNGSLETFALDTADGSYSSPAGNSETLRKNADGSYTFKMRSRSTDTFQVVNSGGPYLLTKRADPDGNTTTLTYNSSNMLTQVQDASGRSLTLTYNTQVVGPYAVGTLVTQVSDGTRNVAYGYDSVGHLTSVTDVGGGVITYVYDSPLNPHLITKLCDQNNQPGVVAAPKCLQNVYEVDPNKATRGGGYRLSQQIDPMGTVTQFTYDTPHLGDHQVIRDPGAAPHLNQTATYHEDGAGHVVSFTDPMGVVTRYDYDVNGQLLRTTVDAGGPGHLNLTSQRIYDARGNLVETIDPNGRTIAYTYGDDPNDSSYDQMTQTVVDPVPPSGGGAHLTATTTFAYYPQASTPAGFTGNPGDLYSVTDPLGHVTRYSYNSAGQRTMVQDANGHYTTYSYDANGMPAQVVVDPTSLDPGGLNLVGTAQYDSLGRLVKKTDPSGITTAYTENNFLGVVKVVVDPYDATTNPHGLNITTTRVYDKAGNTLSQTVDPTPSGGTTCNTAYGGRYIAGCHMNQTTTTTYNANNHAISTTYPINGIQVTYPGATAPTTLKGTMTLSYDALGNVTKVTDPSGASTTYTYDADERLIAVTNALDGAQVVYPDGTSHTFTETATTQYDAAGRVTKQIDPSGLATLYTYDNTNEVTAVTVDPGGAALTMRKTYDSAGRLLTQTDPRNDITSYSYDAGNRLLAVQSPLGVQTTYTYDALGNTLTQTLDPLPQGQTSGHAAILTQYTYDAANRPTSTMLDPNVPPATGHLALTTSAQYDPDGRVLQATDANGHVTKYGYDRIGRQISVTDAHAVATNGPSWRVAYDYVGNVRQTTDPLGHITTTQYDIQDRPIQQVIDPNPVGGTGHLALTSAQYYDNQGNVVYTTNANHKTTAYSYDVLGELTKVAYRDTSTPDIATYYDDAGHLLYMTDGTGGVGTYWKGEYDALGRTLGVTDPAGAKVSYGYDANGALGLLSSVTYPSGHGLQMSYDLDGNLVAVNSPNNALFGTGTTASTTSFQYTYDTADRLAQVSYPNGIAIGYGFDTAGRTTSKTATASGTTLATWGYTLDKAGNPTQITDSTVGGTGNVTYGYDEASRLTSAAYWDGSTQTYTYDAAGNRASVTAGGTTATYSYDTAGRLKASGATTYGYDNDGNRTSMVSGGTTTTYIYDQADRLLSMNNPTMSATYTYNGTGLRTSKTVNGTATTYQWDPATQTLLSDGSNEYVTNASGGLLAQTPLTGGGGSAAQFGVSDQLGSTRLLTNTTAQTQGSFAYDAYGQPKASSGTAKSPLGYAGQLTDGESGFQFLRSREYDPQTGQFLERDSYGGSASTPTSLNRYTYGGDNPAVNTDPSGHCWMLSCVGEAFGRAAQALDAINTFVDTERSVCSEVWTCLKANGHLLGRAAGACYEQDGTDNILNDIQHTAWEVHRGLCDLMSNGSQMVQTMGQAGEMLFGPVSTAAVMQAVLVGGVALGVGVLTAGLMTPVIMSALGAIGIQGSIGIAIAGVAVGALSGMAGQGVINLAYGRPLMEGMGQAAALGGALGLVGSFSSIGEGLAGEAGDVGGLHFGMNDRPEGIPEGDVVPEGDVTTGDDACSFSANTTVATPSGARAIASLHVGDRVIAYDPTTGTTSTQTVQHVWINHDTDLFEVTLHTEGNGAGRTAGTSDAKQHEVALRAHGLRAPPDDQADLARTGPTTTRAAATAGAALDETIHTTANHPWLTTDRGWVPAGDLHSGEQIVREGGAAPATVTALRVAAGAADYYNLTVSVLHTYAVGDGQYVVHNKCDGGLWKRTDYKGKRVYQRDDLIDPSRTDQNGMTSLDRMRNEQPPIGPDGEAIQLHHMLQTDDSPIAEVTGSFHRSNYDAIHVNIPKNLFPSGVIRGRFNSWRRSYWKWRANDFQS